MTDPYDTESFTDDSITVEPADPLAEDEDAE